MHGVSVLGWKYGKSVPPCVRDLINHISHRRTYHHYSPAGSPLAPSGPRGTLGQGLRVNAPTGGTRARLDRPSRTIGRVRRGAVGHHSEGRRSLAGRRRRERWKRWTRWTRYGGCTGCRCCACSGGSGAARGIPPPAPPPRSPNPAPSTPATARPASPYHPRPTLTHHHHHHPVTHHLMNLRSHPRHRHRHRRRRRGHCEWTRYLPYTRRRPAPHPPPPARGCPAPSRSSRIGRRNPPCSIPCQASPPPPPPPWPRGCPARRGDAQPSRGLRTTVDPAHNGPAQMSANKEQARGDVTKKMFRCKYNNVAHHIVHRTVSPLFFS